MNDFARFRELLDGHRDRLSIYLRALLPSESDADAAYQTTVTRIQQQAHQAQEKNFAEWCEGIARHVASDVRRTQKVLPFSDDLLRQLADTAGGMLARTQSRSEHLAEILERMPPPERELLRRKHELGLSVEQIALTEKRPVAVVARDLTLLHGTLVSALREAVPDGRPLPPGGASDLGRLSDQLLDGTLGDDGRLVLETLLLADDVAQSHYLRHVALASELKWKYRGRVSIPAAEPLPGLSISEWGMTLGFVFACLIVLALVALVVGNQLNAW